MVANTDFQFAAIGADYHAVSCQLTGEPLVLLFDAAVIVGLYQRRTTVLVQRILLQINTG